MAGKALVLGGGGVTGVAWELGVLAGLAEAGLDLRDADLVVGTSAGSVVGAQITTGESLDELYERQLAGVGQEIAARLSLGTLLRLGAVAVSSRNEQTALRRVGAMAVKARTTVSPAERRAVIGARLPVHEWPDRRLLITAVAADTGEFVVFDRESGVSLVDAVAASCAVPVVWPSAEIDGRRYYDGGIRSGSNADLAAGYERVVVLAPTTSSFRPSTAVAAQLARLPEGTRTMLVHPDPAALKAIGRNVLDPQRRAPAARAGRRQAQDIAAEATAVWRGAEQASAA
jgi:NTE family protein